MGSFIQIAGPGRTITILGIPLVGANADTGKKLLITAIFLVLVFLITQALKGLARLVLRGRRNQRLQFWTRQAVQLISAIVLVVGLVSIWFNDPSRLATAAGLITAGLAVALQKAVTAFAGYFVILRGKTFNVGDRIVMGGVRGDVISLGFMQTTIMEMGQPGSVQQQADPAMWVKARQYTGRIVTVTNDKIFDEPVYNYTKEFPYLWEEMSIPVPYDADRKKAEQIILDVTSSVTVQLNELGEDAIQEMERRYFVKRTDLGPRVYFGLTDNWLEMTVRFITREHGIRDMKDKMSREIIRRFDEAGIGIASGTYEVVGFPPVKVELVSADGKMHAGGKPVA